METRVVKSPRLSLTGPSAKIPSYDIAVGAIPRFSPNGRETVVSRGHE